MNDILEIIANDLKTLKDANLKLYKESDGLFYSNKVNSDNIYIESLQIIKRERDEFWISYNARILEHRTIPLLELLNPIFEKNQYKVKEFNDYIDNENIYSEYLDKMERLDLYKYENTLIISLTFFG